MNNERTSPGATSAATVDNGEVPTSSAESGFRTGRDDRPQPSSSIVRPQRLPRWVNGARIGLLASVDFAALTLAAGIAVLVWAVGVRHQSLTTYLQLAPLGLLFTLAYAKAGLYPGFGLGPVETLRRLVLWTGFVFLVLAAGSFATKAPPSYSRMTFVIALLLSVLLLPIFRALLLHRMSRFDWWTEPAVVVGSGPLVRQAIEALDQTPTFGYRPKWLLAPSGSPFETVTGVPMVGRAEDAEQLAARGVRVALVTCEGLDEGNELVERLQRDFRHVILIRQTGIGQIEGVVVRNLGAVLGLEFPNQLLLRRNRFLKRCLDLCIALPALLLALPVIAVAALAMKLVSPGPVFFHHEREGLGGRSLRLVKLRTMFTDAEERLQHYLAEDPSAREEWNRCFKLSRDPRIIPVLGTFLRRFSIDELPQLWSVLKGEMSLVGPRPFPQYHLRSFSPRFRDLRRRVRPGLTGLWQVMVRSSGGMDEQEHFDSYYIRNWSVWMDLYVLARTVGVVLGGKGAY